MTHSYATDLPATPGPGHAGTQKFGRIEEVRPGTHGTEVDLRQPDGAPLTALLYAGSVDAGVSAARVGRNIWLRGHLDGAVIEAGTFAVFSEEP